MKSYIFSKRRPLRCAAVVVILLAVTCLRARAQHLWWDTEGLKDATCLYGEITVLATHYPIYYCGANWHPGEPAGGYCGIQHNSATERRTIFSIWDTTKDLHPRVTDADPKTVFGRFGGEGEGGHTHMIWNWKAGETFRFYLQKIPGAEPNTTVARYYVHDRDAKRWRHSATIASPNGDAKATASVSRVGGGGLASFLENFGGTDREVPKLALYRLWLGRSPSEMTCLTRATGDGHWGTLGDAYFLAEGDEERLKSLLGALSRKYGEATFGGKGARLVPIKGRPLPAATIRELKSLPRAPKTPRG